MPQGGSFDPHARLAARDANSMTDLRRQFGRVGTTNGPRTGPLKRRTTSNEAYVARRWILHQARTGRLDFPISVEHTDDPDFTIWHAGVRVPLEFTEVCPASEGRAMALQRAEAAPVGDYSDTGTDKALLDLEIQFREAVDRKREKTYAREPHATLLLYPNSDASMWIRFFRRRNPFPFLRRLEISPFESVHVYWSDRKFYSAYSNGIAT